MDEQYKQALSRDFPQLLGASDQHTSTAYITPECGNGWFRILHELCGDTVSHCHRCNRPLPRVEQIKEKLGELRFYAVPLDAELRARIAAAQKKSLRTCELCGSPGRLGTRGGHLCVRCSPCAVAEDDGLQAGNHEPGVAGETHRWTK